MKHSGAGKLLNFHQDNSSPAKNNIWNVNQVAFAALDYFPH